MLYVRNLKSVVIVGVLYFSANGFKHNDCTYLMVKVTCSGLGLVRRNQRSSMCEVKCA
jgi:hypothetical protein